MAMAEPETGHHWWQRDIIYQVYPRSLMDSDGDGVGDLRGIAERLDYLQWLGVDAIWISPIYPSPMADFGYDVADYTGIYPPFGTLADFDHLQAEAHRRGIRIILDFVPNHSSDEHPWFVESRASRDNPKRDWYIWRDPAPGGGPPNNWLSFFGGDAWEYDATTGQYYLHLFDRKQPDLNWRNPDVRQAMCDVLRFWLDRGVDGFRVDVIWLLIKDEQLRDNPPNPAYRPGLEPPRNSQIPLYNEDQPEVFDVIAELRAVVDAYDERILIGEIYLPVPRLVTYYCTGGRGVHMPYNFQLILLPWEARTIDAAISTYEAALPIGAWPNWVLGNHDNRRIASRIGSTQARVAAMLLLTLRGTPTLYYGDEIGMRDVQLTQEQVQDPQGRNLGLAFSRDPERSPMQWDASDNAGFTRGTPWLPVAADYPAVNVAAQRDDPTSTLTLYQRLIALRRETPALSVGGYASLPAEGDLLAYLREAGGERYMIVLNLGRAPQTFDNTLLDNGARLILSTYLDRDGESVSDTLSLRPDEGLIVALSRAG